MSKIVAIIGATGGQGGSVVDALLKSKSDYRIRGITRNIHSAAAKALASKGVDLVNADLNDQASVVKAFSGAHAIFAVTDFFEPFQASGPQEAMKIEYQQGVNMARAALQTPTLEHYIWSTLPTAEGVSGGEHSVPHFEAKAKIDAFIKSQPDLLAKTTFLWITFYASNLFFPVLSPTYLKSVGKHAWLLPSPASTLISSAGDHRTNVGIFAKGILAHPEKTLSKYVFGNVETMTSAQYLELWSKITRKEAMYIQVAYEDYCKVYPVWGEEIGRMMMYWGSAGEKSWSGKEEIVTVEDIGVKAELVSTEEAMRGLDWSGF